MRCVEPRGSSGGVRVFCAIDRDSVLTELKTWAGDLPRLHPEVVRVGLFGSYAKGNYAPGSDIDILIVVRKSEEPVWFLRSAAFDTSALSVPADLFVYTEAELSRMKVDNPFIQRILTEIVWVSGD